MNALEEKLERQKGGDLYSPENFKIYGLENTISEKNTKDMLRGGKEGYIFRFSPQYCIRFLVFCLWNFNRIKETVTQRHQYDAKRLSVIPIK